MNNKLVYLSFFSSMYFLQNPRNEDKTEKKMKKELMIAVTDKNKEIYQ